MQNSKPLLIGQLAARAGVKSDSVRFYERSGLLPKPSRSSSGYRTYDEAAVQRLRFIKKAQALGFSLDEVRRILSLRGRGAETCRCVTAMAEATLSEMDVKLRELQEFRDALEKTLRAWRRRSPKPRPMGAEFCALIESAAIQTEKQSRSKTRSRSS